MSANKEATVTALHKLCETILEFESASNINTINVALPNCMYTIFTVNVLGSYTDSKTSPKNQYFKK